MQRQKATKTRAKHAAGLAAAYLLGIGSGLLAFGVTTGDRGFAAGGALALAGALVAVLLVRAVGRRPTVEASRVAWGGAPAVGQELPTVSDYYSNSPDGQPPTAPSRSPYRRWEPLPPEGAELDPATGVHRALG